MGLTGKLVIFLLLTVGIIGSIMILTGIWNMISGIVGMVALEKQRQRPARLSRPAANSSTPNPPPSSATLPTETSTAGKPSSSTELPAPPE